MESHYFEKNKHMKLLICYGSEKGYAQSISEKLYKNISFLNKDLKEADNVKDINTLNNYDIIIFIFSTCLFGKFPKNSQKFWNKLKSFEDNLNFKYCVLGIGDISYNEFCTPAKKVSNKLSLFPNSAKIYDLTLLDDSINHEASLQDWIKDIVLTTKNLEKDMKIWFSNSMNS